MEKKRIENFEDLRVWQKGIELVKQVYFLTAAEKLSKDFGLRDQLQRSAVSVPTNIAEGFERSSRKEYIRFLLIAKGSAGEVRSLLRVALELNFIDQVRYNDLRASLLELSRSLAAQIRSLQEADW
jgi:four helix bundle protein